MKKTAIFALITSVALSAVVLGQPNLVINGDFEAGGIGPATSEYTLVSITGHNTMEDPATYAVGTSPYDYHSAWENYYDHTHGDDTGKMLIVNAATEDKIIWQQTVDVTPGRQ